MDINTLSRYDLIGFGSGIYYHKHHGSLLNLVERLPDLKGKKAFIFSTSGVSKLWHFSDFHKPLREKLLEKGFDIIGEFDCRGWDTVGPFKLIGGISKGRPNEEDLEQAMSFARRLKDNMKGGKMQDNERIKKERKFWDKLAPKYDQFIEDKWKIYTASLLNKISEDVNAGDTVLEVACGTGLIALKVADKVSKVYGIDISAPMIEEAKKKMQEKEIKNIEFLVKDAYSLPFGKERFDTVICNNALHNMINPHKALSEIRRVIKPEGRLIASIVGIGESFKFKFAMTIYKLFTAFPVFHKLNLEESANMISESGFSVVKKEIIKHPEDTMSIIYIVATKRKEIKP